VLFDIRCHWLRSGEEDEELEVDEEPELLALLPIGVLACAGACDCVDHWPMVLGVDAACGSGFMDDGAVKRSCC